RREVVLDDVAVQLDERAAAAGEALEDEAGAAEDARAEALLQVDAELDAGVAADEAVPVDGVLAAAAAADLDLADLARRLRGERHGALAGVDRVRRHEEGAAAERALRRAEQPAGHAAA